MTQHQGEGKSSTDDEKLRKITNEAEVQELDTNFEVEVAYLEWPQLDK